MILKPSLDIHEGPNRTARSLVEAAVRTASTNNSRGFWIYDTGPELISQTGVCPGEPRRPINIENHFHFVTMEMFTKGDGVCVAICVECHTSW